MSFLQGHLSLAAGLALWVLIFGLRKLGRTPQLKADLRGALYLLTVFLLLRVLEAGVGERLPAEAARWLRVAWELAFAFGAVRAVVALGLWVFRRLGRAPTSKILRDLVDFALYFAIAIPILKSELAIDVATLLGTSAVLSLVLGFALQDTLSNVFAGLSVQLERQFEVGDFITVGAHTGRVLQIAWRSTRIETFRREQITLPNSLIAKEAVKNYSRGEAVAIELTLPITYAAPPNEVTAEILEALKEIPVVLQSPAPQVQPVAFGDSAVNYLLRYCVSGYEDLYRSQGEIHTRLWYRLRRAGIEIPFPQRVVTIRREGARPQVRQALLKELELFAPFTEGERASLAASAVERRFGRGEHVINEGEEGHSFFVVTRGTFSVRAGKDQAEVARLQRGGHFGEMSLLTGEPRSATVVAHEDAEVLELDREAFARQIAEHPGLAPQLAEVLERRKAELHHKLAAPKDAPPISSDMLVRLRKIFRLD